MEEHECRELVNMVLEQGCIPVKNHSAKAWYAAAAATVVSTLTAPFTGTSHSPSDLENDLSERVRSTYSSTTDAEFLSRLQEMCSREERLRAELALVLDLAHKHLRGLIKRRVKVLFAKLEQIQQQDCKAQIRKLAAGQKEASLRNSRRILAQDIQEANTDTS